ncbi:MAG: MBOAT family protein [Clostridia bacterium]|nr:MBOAT family protein [Clostridia bacterium]
MVFASLFFLCVFFPVFMILYYIFPSIKWRNAILLIFSLIFYSWGEPKYIFLMVFTVILNYFLGLAIQSSKSKKSRKGFLILALAVSLGSLGFFKYSGFVAQTVTSVSGALGGLFEKIPFLRGTGEALSAFNLGNYIPKVALPIGISFYTFQIISYIIDVYRGNVKAQKSPFKLLLYISSFHQLIAGPIVRYDHIAEEIDTRKATPVDIWTGIERFAVGLAKKVVVANLCGSVASSILGGDISDTSVVGAWFGILMFSIQIYFDFSAYSDMAIGMGRMCGFHYHENFNYPYVSRTVSEFWRRWHISLGSFFRDYVYIPMGGNRRHQLLNLFVVWMLTGLWHGASWNFVVWGLYYFVFLVLEKFIYGKVLQKIPVINNIYTLAVVVIGWVFFYYTDFSKAIEMLKSMFGLNGNGVFDAFTKAHILNNIFLFALGVVCCLPVVPAIKKLLPKRELPQEEYYEDFYEHSVEDYIKIDQSNSRSKLGLILSGVTVFVLMAISIIMLVGDSYNPFLYFRF